MNRNAEAERVLEYLHRTKRDPRATFAHAEAQQIKAQVEIERNSPSGFIYIFRTPSHRKRAFCSILLWVMGQATGITTIGNLIPTLLGALGFGTTMQLGLGVVWAVCAVIGCGFNVLLLDRVGRVRLLGKLIRLVPSVHVGTNVPSGRWLWLRCHYWDDGCASEMLRQHYIYARYKCGRRPVIHIRDLFYVHNRVHCIRIWLRDLAHASTQ